MTFKHFAGSLLCFCALSFPVLSFGGEAADTFLKSFEKADVKTVYEQHSESQDKTCLRECELLFKNGVADAESIFIVENNGLISDVLIKNFTLQKNGKVLLDGEHLAMMGMNEKPETVAQIVMAMIGEEPMPEFSMDTLEADKLVVDGDKIEHLAVENVTRDSLGNGRMENIAPEDMNGAVMKQVAWEKINLPFEFLMEIIHEGEYARKHGHPDNLNKLADAPDFLIYNLNVKDISFPVANSAIMIGDVHLDMLNKKNFFKSFIAISNVRIPEFLCMGMIMGLPGNVIEGGIMISQKLDLATMTGESDVQASFKNLIAMAGKYNMSMKGDKMTFGFDIDARNFGIGERLNPVAKKLFYEMFDNIVPNMAPMLKKFLNTTGEELTIRDEIDLDALLESVPGVK